jgi:hypothetical protein
MKAPKAPEPPDPKTVAGAQTGTNIGTAIANQTLGNVNQVTPYGNLTYDVTGTQQWTDPNTGQQYDLPQYTATQTLSPDQMQLLGISNETERNIAEIGRDQSYRIGELLGTPVDLSNEATESRLMELGRYRLDPALDRRRESLRNSLVQQGIMPGSEAYDQEMMRSREAENDAYIQLMLQGRGQAATEAVQERNQPINEISALLSGSQVQAPNFVPTQGQSIPNVDLAGLTMDNYKYRLGNWQQQQAHNQMMMGGLLGTAGNIGAGAIMMSDRRAKTDVRRVGQYGRLPVYAFRYKGDDQERLGFMADEVAQIAPWAVVPGADGFDRVDYDAAQEAAR